LTEIIYEVEEQTLREIGNLTSAKARQACQRTRRTIEQARTERIKPPTRGGSTAEYDLSKLKTHYMEVHPYWEEAKKVFRQNRNNLRWRDIVKAAVPVLSEQHDLIERFIVSPNLPPTILQQIFEQGSDPKPSHLALEHAARLCGCPPYRYSIRHLQAQNKK
jgi:hypothetical protein